MPGIGNPNQIQNNFKNITKYNGPRRGEGGNPNARRAEKNVGQALNDIAGARQNEKFVDKDKHNRLDKDSFLKLLSTQLANQDPFKPVDQKKFAADMAQFAQLEQLTNMNSKMDKSSASASGNAKFMGASFIGKAIHTKGASLPYDGKKISMNLPFYLPKPANNVVIRVFDKANNLIAQMNKETMGKGNNSVSWNARQMDGAPAVKGDYRFTVQAFDEKFQEFKGQTKAEGIVTGVAFEGGETILEVDGEKHVALRDVDSFFLPKGRDVGANSPQKSLHLKKGANAAYNNSSKNKQ